MRKQKNRPQSPWLLVIGLSAALLILIIYATSPSEKKITNDRPTYEEQLEYNDSSIRKIDPGSQNKNSDNQTEQNINQTAQGIERTNIQVQIPPQNIPTNNIGYNYNQENDYNKINNTVDKTTTSSNDYNKLLDTLKTLQPQSINSIYTIVNKILAFKGYPEGIVPIAIDSIDQSGSKTPGSYMVAYFDYVKGEVRISKEQVYQMDLKEIIAILAHELDHFDKYANVCKQMGVTEFKTFFEQNDKKGLNTEFWKKASPYATGKDFDFQTYKNAISRYLNQNKIELTSSYSDYYRMTENIRNPLEESAYKVSDYVYTYYNMPISDGPMKQITKKFDAVDNAIGKIANSNPIIKDERIPLFDYFYSKAIMKKIPAFTGVFNNCITQNDGDLTQFWVNYEKILSDFYNKGQMDARSVHIILSLLSETLNQINQGITDEEIANALKYKSKTIISNIVYPNAIKNIRKTSIAYLQYIKQKGINNPKTELDFILDLICIENQLYKNNSKEISLYYLTIPQELVKLYNIGDKHQRYNFIYKNEAFKEIMANNPGVTDQNELISLLDSHRLYVRIQSYK